MNAAFEFDPDALRQIRRERGMTQAELAKALGSHFTAPSLYERGHRRPDVGALATIARTLGVPMERFIEAAA
ncbi:helix-turn-helix domain-containing protein [Streptomyces sp. NPDC054844]